MLRITTAIFLLTPVFAHAQCVTSADLDTGVTIVFGSSNTSHIQRTDDGTIMDAYVDYDSYYKRIVYLETIDGVIELNRVTHDQESWEPRYPSSMEYDFAVDALAPYAPETRGGGQATRLRPERRDAPKSFGWSVFESEPLVVGECSYEAAQVFITEFDMQRGELYNRHVTYLPMLGFGIQRANSYYSMPVENAIILSMTAD